MDDETLASLQPEHRIKQLNHCSENIKIDPQTPAQRYFNSGDQLIVRANMHLQQNQLEEAYTYYMRYSILIAEKILEHPQYRDLPREIKKKAFQNLAEVIPKAEELKKKLLKIYEEQFNLYLERKKREEKQLLLQKRREQEELQRNQIANVNGGKQINYAEGVRKNTIDKDVVKPVPYLPDDFLVYEIPESIKSSEPAKVNSTTSKPGIDRSTKPAQYTLYNSTKLRPIIVPSSMLDTFLLLAETNTNNNVETCGILAGKLQYNRFIITHLLVPKQYGSSDSCTTDNEEDLFNYQSKHDLITVGWIHTHPSQTAFLSSVDLHTHYSYQLMMSEAIAIVCAPRYSQTGFFHLTPNYGLNFIGNCQQKGFHPHPSEPPLFQTASHCELDENARVEVVDLRR